MLVDPGSRERRTVPHGTCIMLSEICHGATMLLKPTCRSPVLVTTSPRRCSFESCVAIPKRGRGLVLLSRGVSGRFMLSMKPRQKPPGCVLPASRNDDSPLACTIVSANKSSYRHSSSNGRSRCGGHLLLRYILTRASDSYQCRRDCERPAVLLFSQWCRSHVVCMREGPRRSKFCTRPVLHELFAPAEPRENTCWPTLSTQSLEVMKSPKG